MNEIPEQVEQMLRAQGFGDAELDQLRRNGTIQRSDDSGASSVVVQMGGSEPAVSTSSFSIGGVPVDGTSTAQIPPEALANLRRFHKFIPDHALDQLERATGQDIDGDGRIGRDGSTPAAASHEAAIRVPTGDHQRSSAMPADAGPFVQKSPAARALPLMFVIAAIGAAIYFIVR